MTGARCGVAAIAMVFACAKSHSEAPGDCLALPGAVRTNLAADPDGGGLYWFETVRLYNYESQLKSYSNLVHYDLRTRQLDVIEDHVLPPLRFVQHQILVRREGAESSWLALRDRSGRIQSLVPDYLGVVDVEPIDANTIAVLADGDGPRAVYTIDLASPRPRYLIDADVLLSASGGRVYVYAGDHGVVIDPKTGKTESFTWTRGGFPEGANVWYVADSKLRTHPMGPGKDVTAIDTDRPWTLVHQVGAVLARTPPRKDRSYAFLLASGSATRLPTVYGGASILGVTRLGDQSWALIGHNTTNYDADLADTTAETDVCLLPSSGDIRFATRRLPKRWLDKGTAIDTAFEASGLKDANYQVMDDVGNPPTLSFNLSENGGSDFDTMRARARDLHRRVTSVLDEREAKTEVNFADRRIALFRWRRYRLRGYATAGMGNVLATDPADFEIEARDLVDVKEGEQITCSGKLVNLQDKSLHDLELRCISGDRQTHILVPEIGPRETYAFSQTYEATQDDRPLFEIVRNGDPVEYRDATFEGRIAKVLAIAFQVYDETHLGLWDAKTDGAFAITLVAPKGFDDQTETDRVDTATKAYRRFEALRELYGIYKTIPLTLHIEVDHSKAKYDFDGSRLTPSD
jgi:hypothetical protein